MTILQSAAKIVFILMAVAVVALTFTGKVDPKDFMVLASMSFAFYFVTPTPSKTDEVAGTAK
jgi:hypothetical protein